MPKTLVIAEKPSVGRDLAGRAAGHLQGQQGQDRARRRRVRRHLGGRPPGRPRRARRLRREAQEVALRRPADRPVEVQARPERRAREEAALGRPQADQGRRDRPDRERLRRRPRGRAHLRLPLRDLEDEEAGRAALAQLDDPEGDRGRLRRAAAGRGDGACSRPPPAPGTRPTGSSA